MELAEKMAKLGQNTNARTFMDTTLMFKIGALRS